MVRGRPSWPILSRLSSPFLTGRTVKLVEAAFGERRDDGARKTIGLTCRDSPACERHSDIDAKRKTNPIHHNASMGWLSTDRGDGVKMSASQAETYARLAASGGKDADERLKNIALAIAEMASAIKAMEREIQNVRNHVYNLQR